MKVVFGNINDFAYRNETQKKIHQTLFAILKAFTSQDYEKYKEKINRLMLNTSDKVNERSYTAFRARAENWLRTTYFKFSDEEIKALLAMGRQVQKDTGNSDEFLLDALRTYPKEILKQRKPEPKPEPVKPKEKVEIDLPEDLDNFDPIKDENEKVKPTERIDLDL